MSKYTAPQPPHVPPEGLPSEADHAPQPARYDVLRGPRDGRVNLGQIVAAGIDAIPHDDGLAVPAARRILDDDYPADERPYGSGPLRERHKIEVNAITALMIQDAWPNVVSYRERMREAGSDLGVAHYEFDEATRMMPVRPMSSTQVKDPIYDLRSAVKITFDQALHEWALEQKHRQATVPSAEQTPNDRAYARLKAIMDQGYRQDGGVEFFVGTGIATASSAMWNVLEVIPRVFEAQYGRTITAQELEATARNSYPLVLRLAAGNQEIAVRVLDALEDQRFGGNDRPFDPKHFMLFGEGTAASLEITEEALHSFVDRDGHQLISRTPELVTTGCPAIHAKTASGKNVIAEMWDWSLELAAKAYFPRFPQTRPPAESRA